MELTASPEYARGGDSDLTRAPGARPARDAWWVDRFEKRDLEWRRLVAEALGTCLLVLAGTGASVVTAASHVAISRAAAVSAPGLTVLAVILSLGAISGAHLNPAVSLAFAARGDFPWRRVPGYVLAQLLGGTLAVLFLLAVFGRVGSLGATVPGKGIDETQAMLMELVLTTGLVSTILGTASRAQDLGPDLGVWRGRLHHPGRAVVKSGLGCFDEPGALLRPRPGPGRLLALLGLRRRTRGGLDARCRLGTHPARARRSRRSGRRGRPRSFGPRRPEDVTAPAHRGVRYLARSFADRYLLFPVRRRWDGP